MSKIFIDTNLFVYAIDKKDGLKGDKAREILKKIVDSHRSVISTQVIKEFYVVATTKLKARWRRRDDDDRCANKESRRARSR